MEILHTAIPVVRGKMPQALEFMQALGFNKTPYEVQGNWGFAYFVVNELGQELQLTDSFDQIELVLVPPHSERIVVYPMALPTVHVAFGCNVQDTIEELTKLCLKLGMHVMDVEPANEGKVFIYIKGVFLMEFELVPER